MKKNQIIVFLLFSFIIGGGCMATDLKKNDSITDVFPRGEVQKSPFFNKQVWLEMLSERNSQFNCPIANVTFEPGCINWWHSHPGG